VFYFQIIKVFKIYRRFILNLSIKQKMISTSMDNTPPTTPLHETLSLTKSKTSIIDFNDTSSIRSFALLHCKEYLGGIWKTLKNGQFQIDKIS
jgi:hypothetical protein